MKMKTTGNIKVTSQEVEDCKEQDVFDIKKIESLMAKKITDNYKRFAYLIYPGDMTEELTQLTSRVTDLEWLTEEVNKSLYRRIRDHENFMEYEKTSNLMMYLTQSLVGLNYDTLTHEQQQLVLIVQRDFNCITIGKDRKIELTK